MNEVEFRKWLDDKGKKKKVISDTISRLKRIERELDHCDLDELYRNDRCEWVLAAFEKMGNNEKMQQFPNTKLPIGKYYMSTYRYCLKLYVQFCNQTIISEHE